MRVTLLGKFKDELVSFRKQIHLSPFLLIFMLQ